MRAVGVALVLADVLGPARGEVAAEDGVGQLQGRIAGVDRRSAGAARRSDDCTDPGRSMTSSGPGSIGRQLRHPAAGACARPVGERVRATWSSARAGATSPTTTSTASDGRTKSACSFSSCLAVVACDVARLRAGRARTGGRRTSGAPAPRRPRRRPGTARWSSRSTSALALGRDLVVRVGRVGQRLGDDRQQLGQVGREHAAADQQPVGVDADAQHGAEPLDGRGQTGAVVAARCRSAATRSSRSALAECAARADRNGMRSRISTSGTPGLRTAMHPQPGLEDGLGRAQGLGAPGRGQRRDGGHWAVLLAGAGDEFDDGAPVGPQAARPPRRCRHRSPRPVVRAAR